jgi:hypothetical protein
LYGAHLDQHAHHVRRRAELAALLALGVRELGEEVFVDAAERVLGALGRIAERDVAHEVDELAEALLVETRAGVVLGQHVLQRHVVALDRGHRVIDELADRGLRSARLKVRPACLLRHPEDARGAVLVRVLGVGALGLLRGELGVLRLEGVGDVLEEDEAEDDVLVLGRVHVVAQRIGGGPELRLEAEVGCGVTGLGPGFRHEVFGRGSVVSAPCGFDTLGFWDAGRELATEDHRNLTYFAQVERPVHGSGNWVAFTNFP